MSNLKSRIERIEKRVAIVDRPRFTLDVLYHYLKLSDPEGFRAEAMDPDCSDRMMRDILDTPTPKKVLRMFRQVQLGLIEFPLSETSGTTLPAHTKRDSPRRREPGGQP